MEHKPLYSELESIIGEEGYKEIFSSVKETSLKGASFLAGKTTETFKNLFNKASRELITTLGSNRMKITQAEKQAKAHHPALFFTNDILEKLSSTGKADDLVSDAENLNNALKSVKEHILEIQTLNEKKLGLLKKITGIKKTGDATSILQSLEELKFPAPKFPHKDNVMLVTNILPRGKVFEYNTTTHNHEIASKETESKSGDNALPSNDVNALLKEVEKLNEVHRVVAKANQDYLDYLKKFNIVIKESFEYLENSKDILSASVKRDLMNRLEGDKNVFSFYTGFLPKVVNYVDEYIHILTSYLISKTV